MSEFKTKSRNAPQPRQEATIVQSRGHTRIVRMAMMASPEKQDVVYDQVEPLPWSIELPLTSALNELHHYSDLAMFH